MAASAACTIRKVPLRLMPCVWSQSASVMSASWHFSSWTQMKSASWLASQLNDKLVVDGRNLYSPAALASAGLRYVGVGRRSPQPA